MGLSYRGSGVDPPRRKAEEKDRIRRSYQGSTWLEQDGHLHQILDHVNSGYLPLKYAYAGSAAYTHDALARTSGYAEVIGSAQHEAGVLSHALPYGLPEQIVEVGPGNGVHTAAWLDAADVTAPRLSGGPRYLGLDFSATLLGLAAETLRVHRPEVEVSTRHWDMEGEPTSHIEGWRRGPGPVLACLLGHTLGNLADPARALRNLALSLRADDTLLVSLTLFGPGADEDVILDPYRSEVFTAAVLEPLRAAAFARADLELELRLMGRTVIGDVHIKQPMTVAGQTFGERKAIRCFASTRFLPEEALALLRPADGWTAAHWAVDGGHTHMAIVARRKEMGGVPRV